MLNKYKKKILKNPEIIALIILTLITIISTTYYNHSKKKIYNNYKEAINNIYLKKKINYFFNSLEPKYKKITHKISEGETFDNILTSYSIDKSEIQKVKKKLSEKVNLNKLNTNQKIQFTLDQSSSLLKEFIFQETFLVEDYREPETFIELETIDQLEEWFEEETRREEEIAILEEPEEEFLEEIFEEEVVALKGTPP